MRAELGFSEARLGVTVGLFFAVASLTSAPSGHLVDRMRAHRAMIVGVACSAVALAGVAGSRSWWQLAVAVTVAGGAHALLQVGGNRIVSDIVPRGWRGTAFGTKQSSIPLATLTAGIAVPVIGVSLGWRWVFGIAAAVAVVVAAVLWRLDTAGTPRAKVQPVSGTLATPRAVLWLLAVGLGLAAAAANSTAAFLVEYAVSVGVPLARAGLVLAVGSAAGVICRIGFGWLADTRVRPDLRWVTGMLVLGTLAYVAMPLGNPVVVTFSGVLAFAAGWGWPGLVLMIVSQHNPQAPAAATGITNVGIFAGAVFGPVAFGVLVAQASYTVAWVVAAGTTLFGAVLIGVARRWMHLPPSVVEA